jgi:hypothetical protein
MVTERVTEIREKREKIPRPMRLPLWAKKIEVEKSESGAALIVSGTGRHYGPEYLPARSQSDQDKQGDIDKQQRAPGLQPRQPPHLHFAGADNPEKQLEFVKRFGPVLASRVENPFPESWKPGDEFVEIVAYQDLSVLDAEQKLFSRIYELAGLVGKLTDWAPKAFAKEEEYCERSVSSWEEFVAHVGPKAANDKESSNRGAKDVDSLLKRDSDLSSEEFSQLKRMRSLMCEILALIDSYPKDVQWDFAAPFSWAKEVRCSWVTDASAYLSSVNIFRLANEMLCSVFNLFPLILVHSNGIVDEMPYVSPSGVRSALYYVLRMEYLGKRKVNICARGNCRAYFIPKAGNLRYCSPRCQNAEKQRRKREREKRARLATQKKAAKKSSKRRVAH